MAEFTRIGGAYFRQSDSGEMYAVSDPDTLKGLKAGQLPFNSVENTRGLSFSPNLGNSGGGNANLDTGGGNEVIDTGGGGEAPLDFESQIKKQLAEALVNYKGVSNISELEVRRQELLRQQLLSAPYSEEGEQNLTGAQKLSMLRQRGTEFEPELRSLEEQIAEANAGDQNAMNNLKNIVAIAKDLGLVGGEDSSKDTSDLQEYKYAKENDGYTGSFLEWQRTNANLKYKDTTETDQTDLLNEMDPLSGSILAQTGMSMQAFFAITGQTSKLSRDAATRRAALQEAEEFSVKRGVDVSTFVSQYEAHNAVLEANIKRVAMTRIMEDEIQGTLEVLRPVSQAVGNGTLKAKNVFKLFAGEQFNDPFVTQYAFHLNQLRSEIAAYNGALQGRTSNSLTVQDYEEAERVIKQGLDSGVIDGLSDAVMNSAEKMGEVLDRSVEVAQRAVWELFGVGENFGATGSGDMTERNNNTPPPPSGTIRMEGPEGVFDVPLDKVDVFEDEGYVEL